MTEKPDYLPDFGPDNCLWLVTVRNQWAVHTHTTEAHAIYDARTRGESKAHGINRNDVQITKITVATYEPLDLQREVIREALVPKGTSVAS